MSSQPASPSTMEEAQEPEASAQMVPMALNKVASELAEQLREHKFKITSEKWVGVYGVSPPKTKSGPKRWTGRVSVGGSRLSPGVFDTRMQAAVAHDVMALQANGPEARTNIPLDVLEKQLGGLDAIIDSHFYFVDDSGAVLSRLVLASSQLHRPRTRQAPDSIVAICGLRVASAAETPAKPPSSPIQNTHDFFATSCPKGKRQAALKHRVVRNGGAHAEAPPSPSNDNSESTSNNGYEKNVDQTMNTETDVPEADNNQPVGSTSSQEEMAVEPSKDEEAKINSEVIKAAPAASSASPMAIDSEPLPERVDPADAHAQSTALTPPKPDIAQSSYATALSNAAIIIKLPISAATVEELLESCRAAIAADRVKDPDWQQGLRTMALKELPPVVPKNEPVEPLVDSLCKALEDACASEPVTFHMDGSRGRVARYRFIGSRVQRGVTSTKPWCSRIKAMRQTIGLGRFYSPEEAAIRYDEIGRLVGNRPMLNFPEDAGRALAHGLAELRKQARGLDDPWIPGTMEVFAAGAARSSPAPTANASPSSLSPRPARREAMIRAEAALELVNDGERASVLTGYGQPVIQPPCMCDLPEIEDAEWLSISEDWKQSPYVKESDGGRFTAAYSGVNYTARGVKHFYSRTRFRGTSLHIGTYATAEEAAMAYDYVIQRLGRADVAINFGPNGKFPKVRIRDSTGKPCGRPHVSISEETFERYANQTLQDDHGTSTGSPWRSSRQVGRAGGGSAADDDDVMTVASATTAGASHSKGRSRQQFSHIHVFKGRSGPPIVNGGAPLAPEDDWEGEDGSGTGYMGIRRFRQADSTYAWRVRLEREVVSQIGGGPASAACYLGPFGTAEAAAAAYDAMVVCRYGRSAATNGQYDMDKVFSYSHLEEISGQQGAGNNAAKRKLVSRAGSYGTGSTPLSASTGGSSGSAAASAKRPKWQHAAAAPTSDMYKLNAAAVRSVKQDEMPRYRGIAKSALGKDGKRTWRARIETGGTRRDLGQYSTAKAAAVAYDIAAWGSRGTEASTNFTEEEAGMLRAMIGESGLETTHSDSDYEEGAVKRL